MVMAVYEARPLPQDHKQELEVMPLRSGCGDGCVRDINHLSVCSVLCAALLCLMPRADHH